MEQERRSRGDVTRVIDAKVATALAKATMQGVPVTRHHKRANWGRKTVGVTLMFVFVVIQVGESMDILTHREGMTHFLSVFSLLFFGGLAFMPESMDKVVAAISAIRGKKSN